MTIGGRIQKRDEWNNIEEIDEGQESTQLH